MATVDTRPSRRLAITTPRHPARRLIRAKTVSSGGVLTSNVFVRVMAML
ncbi:hypothetical protein [Desulfosporosinus sp. OT]|nr:hypothetical protein [Desulfosporosinus sp. OT]EGW40705.1 hypothetical protein DOT_1329 [Desulfosporosinus sp. OT]